MEYNRTAGVPITKGKQQIEKETHIHGRECNPLGSRKNDVELC
jgi:hypothetical protein